MTMGDNAIWCLRFLSGALKGRTITLRSGSNTLGSATGCDVILPGGEVQPRHLLLHIGELVVTVQKAGAGSARVNGEELQQQRKSLLAGDIVSLGAIDFELDRSFAESDDPMFAWSESMLLDDDLPKPPAAQVPARRTTYWAGAATSVLALAGLAAVAAWGGEDARRDGASFNVVAVQKILATYPEVEMVAAPGGQFALKGYVESRLRKQSLDQAMQPFSPHVVVSVQSAEEMVEQARRYVNDPGIAMTYAGRGHLVVSGTADDESVRSKIRRLGEDLHPTVLVSDKVQYKPVPQNQSPDAAAQWSAWQAMLPSRMVSITEDDNGARHIQLANGSRYYEGTVLRSGAELQGISVERLTLNGGERKPAR